MQLHKYAIVISILPWLLQCFESHQVFFSHAFPVMMSIRPIKIALQRCCVQRNKVGFHKRRSLVVSMVDKNDQSDGSQPFLMTQSLLKSSIHRATRTMSELSNPSSKNLVRGDNNVNNLMEAVINRSSNIMQSKTTMKKDNVESDNIMDDKEMTGNDQRPHVDKRQYLSNPSVTPTALAHSLWAQVVHPYSDTLIDATCGNGKDTLFLANLLFPAENDHDRRNHENLQSDFDNVKPQIIGIDIQKQACENTMQLLSDHLPSHIVQNNIQIIHSSHAPLPRPTSSTSVGLICYNLGYLPGSGSSNKHVSTKMITTVYSLADAALLLRVGGLLSIMAYPGSSYLEYCSVKYFVEGLALFTSKDDWRDFVDSIPNNDILLQGANNMKKEDHDKVMESTNCEIRESVRVALERVIKDGDGKQTWRAFDHRPIGRPMSPILFTATRIK